MNCALWDNVKTLNKDYIKVVVALLKIVCVILIHSKERELRNIIKTWLKLI